MGKNQLTLQIKSVCPSSAVVPPAFFGDFSALETKIRAEGSHELCMAALPSLIPPRNVDCQRSTQCSYEPQIVGNRWR